LKNVQSCLRADGVIRLKGKLIYVANTKGPGVGKDSAGSSSLLNGWFFRDGEEQQAAGH